MEPVKVNAVGVNASDPEDKQMRLKQGDDLIVVERFGFTEMMARLRVEGQRLGWVVE